MKLKELMEKIKNNKKQIIINIFVFFVAMAITLSIFVPVSPQKDTPINLFKPQLQIILSPDCMHCQIANTDIFKNLDILSDKYTLNPIYVGNIDMQQLKIVGVPTFILYKGGVEVKRVVGFSNTTTLIEQLEEK